MLYDEIKHVRCLMWEKAYNFSVSPLLHLKSENQRTRRLPSPGPNSSIFNGFITSLISNPGIQWEADHFRVLNIPGWSLMCQGLWWHVVTWTPPPHAVFSIIQYSWQPWTIKEGTHYYFAQLQTHILTQKVKLMHVHTCTLRAGSKWSTEQREREL